MNINSLVKKHGEQASYHLMRRAHSILISLIAVLSCLILPFGVLSAGQVTAKQGKEAGVLQQGNNFSVSPDKGNEKRAVQAILPVEKVVAGDVNRRLLDGTASAVVKTGLVKTVTPASAPGKGKGRHRFTPLAGTTGKVRQDEMPEIVRDSLSKELGARPEFLRIYRSAQ